MEKKKPVHRRDHIEVNVDIQDCVFDEVNVSENWKKSELGKLIAKNRREEKKNGFNIKELEKLWVRRWDDELRKKLRSGS